MSDLIDSHCHLDAAEFDGDRERVLQRCREQGVRRIVVPAVQARTWDDLLDLCRREHGLYPALGLHPVYLSAHSDADVDALAQRLPREPVVAVGEIGLDFFIDAPDRDRQMALFEAQLEIARVQDLPVLLHVRKAHDEVLSCLRRIPVRGGIAHAFNGSEQQAHRYLDLNFKLGYGGMLTYPRSRRIRALAAGLPASAIVLETDAPDMAVASHHGERNSPEYLPQCLAALAEVRGEPVEELAAQTTANVLEVLDLS